jgi:hypothetical protein
VNPWPGLCTRQFSVPSVWQVLVQLLNLPEGVGQAFIDRGQRI